MIPNRQNPKSENLRDDSGPIFFHAAQRSCIPPFAISPNQLFIQEVNRIVLSESFRSHGFHPHGKGHG